MKRMYVVSPVYVQRSYAASDGIYKVHAASKAAAAQRAGDDRPLFDLLMTLSASPFNRPKPAGSSEEANRRPAQRAPQQGPAAQEEEPQSAVEIRQRDGGYIPNPLDRTAQGKPFVPFGRFKEPGYDSGAGFSSKKPLSASGQKPWHLIHAEAMRAYRTSSFRGALLAELS